MDNLTHSLVGALFGQAGLKRKTGLAMPALILGANLPDIDATCVIYGIEHVAMRRGVTHGPIAWVLLPLALAGVLWWFDSWQERRGKRPEGRLPVRFGWLWALTFIAFMTHPALDWLNAYGIRLLSPFSERWFYGDTLFIIDVWLWAILGFATWLSLRRENRGQSMRWPAISGLVLATAYIGLNLSVSTSSLITFSVNNKEPGLSSGRRFLAGTFSMIALPEPIFSLDRQVLVGRKNDWYIVPEDQVPSPRNARAVTDKRCAWPAVDELFEARPDLEAFLFWSRAPFAMRGPDGSVVIQDARFYDPDMNSRFSIALPEVQCEQLPSR